MKALYGCTIVDVVEKTSAGYRINTKHGAILLENKDVFEIPDEIIIHYADELEKLESYIQQIREKIDEINHRYYTKKLELDEAITKVKVKKVLLINEMKMKTMHMKGDML